MNAFVTDNGEVVYFDEHEDERPIIIDVMSFVHYICGRTKTLQTQNEKMVEFYEELYKLPLELQTAVRAYLKTL